MSWNTYYNKNAEDKGGTVERSRTANVAFMEAWTPHPNSVVIFKLRLFILSEESALIVSDPVLRISHTGANVDIWI